MIPAAWSLLSAVADLASTVLEHVGEGIGWAYDLMCDASDRAAMFAAYARHRAIGRLP